MGGPERGRPAGESAQAPAVPTGSAAVHRGHQRSGPKNAPQPNRTKRAEPKLRAPATKRASAPDADVRICGQVPGTVGRGKPCTNQPLQSWPEVLVSPTHNSVARAGPLNGVVRCRSASGGAEVLISVLHIGSALPAVTRTTVPQPTWEQIEAAVWQMDGHGRCEVSVMTDDEHYLSLGGGADGIYVCQVETPQGSFVVRDLTQPGGQVVPVNDGQPSLYDARHVIDLGRALQATHYFATTGQMDPSLEWYRY